MRRTVSDISLDYLLVRDHELISHIEAGSAEGNILIGKVRDFLSYWVGRPWQDTEALEVAGAKLFLAAAPAVWSAIRAMVTSEFPPTLSKPFLNIALSRERPAQALREAADPDTGPPFSLREFERVAAEIEEGRVSGVAEYLLHVNEQYQETLTSERAVRRYLSFLARMLGRLSAKSPKAKKERASLIHRLSRGLLTWAPWQEKPWGFMIHAYELEDAYREAETVIWETIRRFDSANAWKALVNHLSSFSDRFDDFDYYSRRALEVAPDDSYIVGNRIRAILRNNDPDQLPMACELSGRLLNLQTEKHQHELKHRLFLNTLLLQLQRGGKVDRTIDAYAGAFLETTNALGSLVWIAQRFARAVELGLMIVSRGLAEAPEQMDLWDCKGLLMVIQGGAALDTAIEQGERAIREGADSAATRNWLAKGLIKRNAEGDRLAARDHLIVNIRKFSDEVSRRLLALINDNRLDDIVADVRSQDKNVDVSLIKGVGDEHFATKSLRFSESAPSRFPLPDRLFELSTLRRISILLSDEPSSPRRAEAVSELEMKWRKDVMSADGSTRAYIELLMARVDTAGAHESELPTFAARFEYAVNRRDKELLEEISREHSRLSALSLIARAMFGDEDAAVQVGRYMGMSAGVPPHEKPLHDKLIRQIFAGVPPSIDDGAKIVALFRTQQSVIEPLVRRANEALVYLPVAA